jgi:hypothetical protein
MFILVLDRSLSSGVNPAECPQCSFWYLVGDFVVSDADEQSLLHMVLECDIDSNVPMNVVTSFVILLRSQGRYLSFVAALHISPC